MEKELKIYFAVGLLCLTFVAGMWFGRTATIIGAKITETETEYIVDYEGSVHNYDRSIQN